MQEAICPLERNVQDSELSLGRSPLKTIRDNLERPDRSPLSIFMRSLAILSEILALHSYPHHKVRSRLRGAPGGLLLHRVADAPVCCPYRSQISCRHR